MMRLWTRSLAARFICLMLLALVISQAISFLVSWDERGQALRAAAKGEFFSRTASLAKVLEATPHGLQDDILDASGTAYTRFWLSPAEPPAVETWRREALARLAQPLPNLKSHGRHPPAEEAEGTDGGLEANWLLRLSGVAAAADTLVWRDLPAHAGPLGRTSKFVYLDDANGMGLSVRLDGGNWLNSVFAKRVPNAMLTTQSALSLGVTALALSLIAIFVAQGIAKPLRRLAAAAEALGRGEAIAPLPEQGPDDMRLTAEAFNQMQARLQRFVEDRTRLLAAIGHDLRTPLTSLRLRAEFVTDPEIQEKMLQTIDEMQTMTEATLSFAREEATAEPTRTVELCALVESLCDDLVELGKDVTFLGGPKLSYRCRPDALRRSVRNLIENAVRYGGSARIGLVRNEDSIDIVITDNGPGIPEEALQQVFAPFFRLERSRNPETGGVGLGLSIARAIARHHGGEVSLRNLDKGLEAVVSLPRIGVPGSAGENRAEAKTGEQVRPQGGEAAKPSLGTAR